MLKRLAAFYSVRVVSYTFMPNHYHSHQARTKRSTVASLGLKRARIRNRPLKKQVISRSPTGDPVIIGCLTLTLTQFPCPLCSVGFSLSSSAYSSTPRIQSA
jgi:hypothetical protein